MNTTVIDGQVQEAETVAIKKVIAALEHSQQNELPDEFVSLFRSDAIWTTGHGKRLTGRAEISAFTHQVLPRAMKDSTATYEVVDVL
ncbi:SgcJ/EcaC family oxidoreductase, partial [Streptomyces sp. NPDC056486]|uniref:SgcJ/EcaC family oxidoreductase n=1 Tax=Streptomyces sp. NPDC056486 TaxID=3345835 RepID=UPI0036C3D40A